MPKPASAPAHERWPESTDKLRDGSSTKNPGYGSRSYTTAPPGLAPTTSTTTTTTKPRRARHHESSDPRSEVVTLSSFLQPRVAVLLDVPKRWHLVLFSCRALSCAPSVWWGAPPALLLLFRLAFQLGLLKGHVSGQLISLEKLLDARLGLTESTLAIVWCGAAAYLSFFFTDCLMSRWLVNYTPQATVVRLLTINAVNGYLTSWALYLIGGAEDPRLLLPAWIGISTALTLMYHGTQRKINIRKETSMTISVFSIASYISMVALLGQLYLSRSDYPTIPLATFAQAAWLKLDGAVAKLVEYGHHATTNAAREL